MLPKAGKDHTSPLNYRPINLLNSLGKRPEKIILKKTKFLRNVERTAHGFNNNNAIVTIFLDTDPAIDKVWTTALIPKIITAKMPPHLLHIVTCLGFRDE
jgi:hypothetical protein